MKTENVCSDGQDKVNEPSHDSAINVRVTDVVLTPLTCASLVNEIFKGLLYQKSQIPYPYSWLESVVNKKRRQGDRDMPKNFSAVNHFRIVSTAYDILENAMKGIIKEFSENGSCVKEVIFIFGTTPQCPKEVFSIDISSTAKGHSERNHANHIGKFQQKILRNIFLSQSWLDSIDASLTCTNTYIFLKKCVTDINSCSSDSSESFFIPSRPINFPTKLKYIKINLNSENSVNSNCCDSLSVFEDEDVQSDTLSQSGPLTNDNECDNCIVWYQSKDFLKGFKDCYVNKVSACELW